MTICILNKLSEASKVVLHFNRYNGFNDVQNLIFMATGTFSTINFEYLEGLYWMWNDDPIIDWKLLKE